MSLPAIQQLIAKQAIDREMLSHFISFDSGDVILRFEANTGTTNENWSI